MRVIARFEGQVNGVEVEIVVQPDGWFVVNHTIDPVVAGQPKNYPLFETFGEAYRCFQRILIDEIASEIEDFDPSDFTAR
jgi:hypothetical protein